MLNNNWIILNVWSRNNCVSKLCSREPVLGGNGYHKHLNSTAAYNTDLDLNEAVQIKETKRKQDRQLYWSDTNSIYFHYSPGSCIQIVCLHDFIGINLFSFLLLDPCQR